MEPSMACTFFVCTYFIQYKPLRMQSSAFASIKEMFKEKLTSKGAITGVCPLEMLATEHIFAHKNHTRNLTFSKGKHELI